MRKWLLICVSLGQLHWGQAQDSTTTAYINSIVEKMDAEMGQAIRVVKDTVYPDEEKPDDRTEALRVKTEYYFHPVTRQLIKAVERSQYRNWITEVMVYFQVDEPVKLSSTKWRSEQLMVDFDLFYLHNNYVSFAKRDFSKARPDADFFLKWSYDLLRQSRTIRLK